MRVVEPVELEVDFEPVPHRRRAVEQGRVAGQADAVGVDHHHLDRLLVGVADHADKIRVQRRLAAGELQDVRDALQLHVAVDHAAVGGEVDVLAAGAGLGEAHRALQVAAGRDLDQGDAGVLFVLGAEAAVERAAAVGARCRRRGGGRAGQLVAVVVGDVRTDEVFDDPCSGSVCGSRPAGRGR